jgi:outer membrane protein
MTFKTVLRGAASVAGLLALSSAAMAADLPSRKAVAVEPLVIDTYQPFQVRLKATAVIPDGGVNVYDRFGVLPTAAGLTFGAGSQFFGSGAKVSTAFIPELDIAYYITKNIAIEAICCLSKHRITGTGFLAGHDIGSTWVFPPTVLLQYHFTNFGAFQPYVGVGVNFTAYPWSKGGNTYTPFYAPGLNAIVGYNTVSNLSISSSWGVAGQVGFDYMLNQNWGINVDLKRIMMQPTAYANVYNTALNAVIPVRAKVNIDPWLVSAGITYRFGNSSSAPVVAKY